MQLIADVRELHKLELLQLTQQLLKVHHNVLLEMQKRQAAGSYIAAYNRAAESLDERAVDCRSSVSQVKRMAWLNPVRLTGPFDVVVYVFSCSTLYWRSLSVHRPQRLVRLSGPFDEGRRHRVFVFYIVLTLTECSPTTASSTSDWSFRRRSSWACFRVLRCTDAHRVFADHCAHYIWLVLSTSSSTCFRVLRRCIDAHRVSADHCVQYVWVVLSTKVIVCVFSCSPLAHKRQLRLANKHTWL